MPRSRRGHARASRHATYAWSALNRRVRRYLRTAWTEGDSFSSGVVIPCASGAPVVGSAIWYLGLAAGLALLAFALSHIRATSTLSDAMHGALFVGSVLLAVGSAVQLSGSRRPKNLGSFRLVDPLRVWEIDPPLVTVRDLDGAGKARVVAGRGGGNDVEIALAEGTERIDVGEPALAREVANYLAAIAKLHAAQTDPTEAGARAAAFARGEPSGPEDIPRSAARVPPPLHAAPGRRSPDAVAGGGTRQRLAIALGVAGTAAALCAALVFPQTRERLRDEHAYAAIVEAPGDLAPVDAYLREFPDGRFAGEVRTQRDHRRFALAEKQSKRTASPDPLHEYLADPLNTRHRPAAEQQIDTLRFRAARKASRDAGTPDALRAYLAETKNPLHRVESRRLVDAFFEDAADRCEALAKREGADAGLVEGLTAAVRAQRRAPVPRLLVRFKSAYEVEPANPTQQLVLVLNRLVLVQPQDTFRDAAIRERETKLLQHLRNAIGGVVGPNLLEIRAAEGEEEADLEILYTVSASVTELYVARSGRFTTVDVGLAAEFREVFHKYTVNATALFHGRRSIGERRTRIFGGPDKVVDLPPAGSKIDPYTGMLESAFRNFTSRLLERLGLEPPAEPKQDVEPAGKR